MIARATKIILLLGLGSLSPAASSNIRGFDHENADEQELQTRLHSQYVALHSEEELMDQDHWGLFGSDLETIKQNFEDIEQPYNPKKDTPFFFMIPKSGTTTLAKYMSECANLVMASSVGRPYISDNLEVVDHNGKNVVNVDVTKREGLAHAGTLGLAESAVADVVISGYIHQTARIFNKRNKARMFTLMRHPLQRTVSEFYYVQIADWEPLSYKPWLKEWTLAQYVKSDYFIDNWMTRQIVGKSSKTVAVTWRDYENAKRILREKCLIGLSKNYEESVFRFKTYFGWGGDDQCIKDLFAPGNKMNTNRHPILEKGTPTYELMVEKDKWDILLYGYAQKLFEKQRYQFNPTSSQ